MSRLMQAAVFTLGAHLPPPAGAAKSRSTTAARGREGGGGDKQKGSEGGLGGGRPEMYLCAWLLTSSMRAWGVFDAASVVEARQRGGSEGVGVGGGGELGGGVSEEWGPANEPLFFSTDWQWHARVWLPPVMQEVCAPVQHTGVC